MKSNISLSTSNKACSTPAIVNGRFCGVGIQAVWALASVFLPHFFLERELYPRVAASVLVNVWSLVPHSCAHAPIVMVDRAYERGVHALSGKLAISMSAYQEAEILHLEIFATRPVWASVLATHV